MARNAAYWSGRRRKQLGRFGTKAIKAVAQPSVGSIAQAAWSGVKYLRTLVNSELYKFDHQTTVAPTSAGTVIPMVDIAQGDAYNQRTGLTIMLNGQLLDVAIIRNALSTTTILRLIVFVDMQQVSDTTPTVADLLANSLTNDFVNPLTAGRYRIVRDKEFILDLYHGVRRFKERVPLTHHVRYNGTASTDIQKGGVYMLLLSNEAVNAPSVVYNMRTFYRDN